jgi:hypothetical protein
MKIVSHYRQKPDGCIFIAVLNQERRFRIRKISRNSGKKEEIKMNFQKLCFAVLVSATMIAASPAFAATCSNATFTGVYGSIDAGFDAGQPEATVTQFTADGKGKLSGTATNSKNGVITTGATFTGTYSVSSACTGSYTVKFTNGKTSSGVFFADEANKGAQTIRTDHGFVKTGFIQAQGTVTCGLTGTKQTFALNLTGSALTIGAVAGAGQVTLNGSGGVSGKGTFSENGTVTSASLSGTYTENSNCTGTAQITLSGFPASNYSFVVVNSGKELLLIETDANTTVSGTMQQ